jgi:hypothetical protein
VSVAHSFSVVASWVVSSLFAILEITLTSGCIVSTTRRVLVVRAGLPGFWRIGSLKGLVEFG